MKRKRARVMVRLVLVCLLTGMLGVSASACTEIGLTYRLNDWGGVKFGTQSGFGGELLLYYQNYAYEGYRGTYLDFQPSLLYRFKASSGTSPYVGIGYLSSTHRYENWGTEVWQESGVRLLAGLEHFFSEKFSFDLRATAYFNAWNETWDSSEAQGTYNGFYVDMGVSISLDSPRT